MELEETDFLESIDLCKFLNFSTHSFKPDQIYFNRAEISGTLSQSLFNLKCWENWEKKGFKIWKNDKNVYWKDHPIIINENYEDF